MTNINIYSLYKYYFKLIATIAREERQGFTKDLAYYIAIRVLRVGDHFPSTFGKLLLKLFLILNHFYFLSFINHIQCTNSNAWNVTVGSWRYYIVQELWCRIDIYI